MTKMEQYFYDGQFLKSALEAKNELTGDNKQQAQQLLALFAKYEYEKFPQTTQEITQSVERANETYEELDEVDAIRAIKDEAQFTAAIQQLEMDAHTAEDVRKAQSFFVQAQLFLLAHHYDESIHCYLQAAQHNPNKALYYGFAGQTMNRFNWSPFETLPYIERAIDLDPTNARWYWNKALVLTQLYKDLQAEPFLENALITIEKAMELCREDQVTLRNGIDSTLENLKEHLFN